MYAYTSLRSSPSLTTLAIACLALGLTTGCAVAGGEGSAGAELVVDSRDDRAPALDPATIVNPGAINAVIGSLDDRTPAVDPATIIGAGVTPAFALVRPAHQFAPGALEAVSIRPFDREVFADAVGRVDAVHVPGFAALPGTPATNATAAETAVRRIMERAAFYKPEQVAAERIDCGEGTEIACTAAFDQAIAGFNGRLANGLRPVVRRLEYVLKDMRLNVWTVISEPLGVTLSGRRDNALTGVVVFR